jgi:ZIP family zinc transporter
MANIGTAPLYTLIPVAAALVAGVVAAYWPPRPRTTSAVQHFAAGVVFAAVAIEPLPELLKHSPAPPLLGFGLGIAAMFALYWTTDRAEPAKGGQRGRPHCGDGGRCPVVATLAHGMSAAVAPTPTL